MFSGEDERKMSEGYKALAIAVIVNTITDACQNQKKININRHEIKEARRCLTGDTLGRKAVMRFWCEVAGYSSDKLFSWANRMEQTGWPVINMRKVMKSL